MARLVSTLSAAMILMVVSCGDVTQISKINEVDAESAPGVELSCKGTNVAIPELAKKFEPLKGQALKVIVKRESATIEVEGKKKITGKALGRFLPTEQYNFSALGVRGTTTLLTLASAGPLLGGKTTTLRLSTYKNLERNLRADESFVWDLRCTNTTPGEVAPFIKLCTTRPKLKGTLTCRNSSQETYGMPNTLVYSQKKNGDLDLTFKIEGDEAEEQRNLKFVKNDKPGMSSSLTYLEFCTFRVTNPRASAFGEVSRNEFYSLWLSRQLTETGHGLAVIPERAADGGSNVRYTCRTQD